MKDAFRQLAVALVFLVGGLLSRSNGVDDRVDQDPVLMLGIASAVVLAGIGVHLLMRFHPMFSTFSRNKKEHKSQK